MLPRTLSFAAFAACLIAAPAFSDDKDYKQNALCVDGKDQICATLPADLTGLKVILGYNPSTNPADKPGDSVTQINFDYFAWQMFVALNWPADANGQPSDQHGIGQAPEAPRMWESYKTPAQVFPGNAAPGTCGEGGGRLVLNQTSKLTTNSFIEPFTPYPLIDSAGNFVVYDIRMNDVEADYIASNGLQTKEGQQAFGKAWDLPRGKGSSPGAIELKTAWRVFADPKDAKAFFSVPGRVEVDAKNSATGQPLCLDVTLGLVGMHIMQKISTPAQFSDYWVWATFEHASNAPLAGGATPSGVNAHALNPPEKPLASCPAPATARGTWSFYDSRCTDNGKSCEVNAPPAKPKGGSYLWSGQPPYAEAYLKDGKYGTQVTRCWRVYETANQVSDQFQQALDGSVWANYRLIGAQWAQGASEGAPSIAPYAAPFYLTNTTLETYLQINEIGIKPNLGKAPGSCIACHNFATDSAGNNANFSFLAGYAQ